MLRQTRDSATATQKESLWSSLPRPLYLFGTLLLLDFISVFAFAFIEPEMVFYFYDELDWTTVQFGIVVGVYGLAMVFGQAGLGQASDKFGRKPVIILGMLLTTTFYFALTTVTWFPLVLLVAFVAGLGAALTAPALSAFYLDITAEQHKSRVVGVKGSASALGGVMGPLAVAGVSGLTTSQGIFIISGVLMLATAGLALAVLTAPRQITAETRDMAWECTNQRAMAAQAALRGIVFDANTIRRQRSIVY
jgi:MFS family permease